MRISIRVRLSFGNWLESRGLPLDARQSGKNDNKEDREEGNREPGCLSYQKKIKTPIEWSTKTRSLYIKDVQLVSGSLTRDPESIFAAATMSALKLFL